MGKAIQERRLVPIPLCPLLFEALQAHIRSVTGAPPSPCAWRAPGACALPRSGLVVSPALAARVPRHHLAVLEAFYPTLVPLIGAASERATSRAGEAEAVAAGSATASASLPGPAPAAPTLYVTTPFGPAPVEDMCLEFSAPTTGAPLGPDPDAPVTSSNVDDYVVALAGYVAVHGIEPCVAATVAGLRDVLDPRRLLMLTPGELADLVCGQLEVHWTAASLMASVVWSHGYGPGCREAGLLTQVLAEFGQEHRRQFLQFVTGCPTLPPGGLAGLSRPLHVIRKGAPGVPVQPEVDGCLPSASTCFHQVKLPPYTSLAIMRERLVFAMQASAGVIDMT
jgi:hypothetical protein